MKKYIVLSVNENPQYLFYLPLTVWAWRKFGWEPFVFLTQETNWGVRKLINIENWNLFILRENNDYKTETLAQVSRLYASAVLPKESYIMTGDIDMIPLSDYWKPNFDKITCWGHDLAGFGHYPICYIGMKKEKWDQVMMMSGNGYNSFIKRDLDNLPQARSTNMEECWVVDQDLITMRLKPLDKTVVNRGVLPNGYAYGRVDRSAWTLNHKELIDCHMLRDIWKNEVHLKMTMELLHHVWPKEDFLWFLNYVKEFAKIVK